MAGVTCLIYYCSSEQVGGVRGRCRKGIFRRWMSEEKCTFLQGSVRSQAHLHAAVAGNSFYRTEKKRHATSKFLFAECARGWSLESCEPLSLFLRFCLCLRQSTFQSLSEPASTNTIAITTSTTATISRYRCTLPLHAPRALRFLRYACNEPQ